MVTLYFVLLHCFLLYIVTLFYSLSLCMVPPESLFLIDEKKVHVWLLKPIK